MLSIRRGHTLETVATRDTGSLIKQCLHHDVVSNNNAKVKELVEYAIEFFIFILCNIRNINK